MAKLFEVKEKLSTKVKRLRELVEKQADLPEDENLPEDEATEIEKLKAAIAKCQKDIEALEAVPDLPEDDETKEDDSTDDEPVDTEDEKAHKQFIPAKKSFVYAQPEKKLEKGLRFARFALGAYYAKQYGPRSAANIISKQFKDDIVAKAVSGLSVSANGASTIPTYFAEEMIELLRPFVAVRKANPVVIDITGGNLTMPRLANTITATWGSENVDAGATVEGFDTITFAAKKLTALSTSI